MIDMPSVRIPKRCALFRTPLIVLLLVTMTALEAVAQISPRVNPQAAALEDFQKRLAAYLDLRGHLVEKLKPLSTTPSASELSARQESLASALREVRKGAKSGDLIPTGAADLIRKTVVEDMKHRTAAEKFGTFEEVANGPLPAINAMYPAQAALPTVPPLLLNNLPRLPDNLQYRFYARHIVLLDGDAGIIVDYIANALPPH